MLTDVQMLHDKRMTALSCVLTGVSIVKYRCTNMVLCFDKCQNVVCVDKCQSVAFVLLVDKCQSVAFVLCVDKCESNA